jgi:ABC-type branched-subunit amino acid transport system ATPase component/branched-subunit amino acid ABC-type transport system permease component
MNVLRLAIAGIGPGTAYGLVAIGLVLIHRSSRVVNFAHGAIGMVGTFAFWKLQALGFDLLVALIGGVVTAALIGVLTYFLVMYPLRTASSLIRVVSTLSVLIVLQGLAYLVFSSNIESVNNFLPSGPVSIFGFVIPSDRLWTFFIGLILTAFLWFIYHFTPFGRSTSAVAENPLVAQTAAISPTLVAASNWMIGSALAALAGILIAPIAGVSVTTVTLLTVPALAAALGGGLISFPIAFACGVAIGSAQTCLSLYVTTPGFASAIPALAILVAVVWRGKKLPLRDFAADKLPRVGSGVLHPKTIAILLVVTILLFRYVFDADWVSAFTVTISYGVVLLSLTIIIGYSGQLSLAQYTVAGIGALVAARLIAATGVQLEVAALAGVLVTVPFSVIVGLPALRTRGVTLAIATLGLAYALETMVFGNLSLTGGVMGLNVGDVSLFWIHVGALQHPVRYAAVTAFVFVATGVAVANLRRSRIGRHLLAIRTNERAAASLGVNVLASKLYAFVLGGIIAGIGGILVAFLYPIVEFTDFTSSNSISMVADVTVGGVGYIIGPLLGGQLPTGGVGTQVTSYLGQNAQNYLPVVGGLLTIVILITHRHGIADLVSHRFGERRRRSDGVAEVDYRSSSAVHIQRTEARLRVSDLSVKFGGVTALSNVSIEVSPGSVVGLIGPNGAGKTTLIDAITGFVEPESGAVYLNDSPITDWSVRRRALAGVTRLFQGLELFEDMSILENLLVAADSGRVPAAAYVTELIKPAKVAIGPSLAFVITELGLADHLSQMPGELSLGSRRLAGIARAVVSMPRVLLLDEAAAGLSPEERRETASLIRRLADEWGMAILVVEHDMEFVMDLCDHLVVLESGRKLAEGPPADIRENRDVVAAYLGV